MAHEGVGALIMHLKISKGGKRRRMRGLQPLRKGGLLPLVVFSNKIKAPVSFKFILKVC